MCFAVCALLGLQLNTTLAKFIEIIETAEGSLNRSAAQLAAMRIFNGTILIQDGTLISAQYVENATRELDAKVGAKMNSILGRDCDASGGKCLCVRVRVPEQYQDSCVP